MLLFIFFSQLVTVTRPVRTVVVVIRIVGSVPVNTVPEEGNAISALLGIITSLIVNVSVLDAGLFPKNELFFFMQTI